MKLHEVRAHLGGGEIDPKAYMRIDARDHDHSLRSGKNLQLLESGAGTNRPGTWFKDTIAPNKNTRAFEFEFSDDERYFLVVQRDLVRAYDYDGNFLQELTGLPYLEAEVLEITHAQSGDIFLLFHRGHPTQQVTRTGLDTFTLAPFEFEVGFDGAPLIPYEKYSSSSATLTADDYWPQFNVTSSEPIFVLEDVGTTILWGDSTLLITAYTSPTSVVCDIIDSTLEHPYLFTGMVSNPFKTRAGSSIVECTVPNHGFSSGDRVGFEDVVGPISPGGLSFWDWQGNNGGKAMEGIYEILEILDEDRFTVRAGIGHVLDTNWYTTTWGTGQSWYTDPDFRVFLSRSTNPTSTGFFDPKKNYDFEVRPGSNYQNSQLDDRRSGYSYGAGYDSTQWASSDSVRWAVISGYTNQNARASTIELDGTNSIESNTPNEVIFGGENVRLVFVDVGTRDWKQPVIGTTKGYPGCGVFHENRLWLSSTLADPAFLASSHIGNFFRFDIGDGLDDESIQFRISGSEEIAEIKHLVSGNSLQIFTTTRELYAVPPREGTYVPSSFRVTPQTHFGSGKVHPQRIADRTLFVQKGGKAVREFQFNERYANHTSVSLSILASHLLKDPIDLAVIHGSETQQENYAIVLNSDGTLAIMYANPAEERLGWTPWECGQSHVKFVDMCVVGDRLFFIMSIDQNLYVCQMAEDENDYLDLAETYTNATPTTAWTLSPHFYNQTVDVLINNQFVQQVTADASGNINLSQTATAIDVGIGYEVECEFTPPTVALPTGARFGLIKGIAHAIVHFHETQNQTLINGVSISRRNVSDDPTVNGITTGKRHINTLGYNRDPTIKITQANPGIVRILGATFGVLI